MKTISSRGLTEKDQLVLKSLIDLVITRTKYSWSYTDNHQSNVAIIDSDNLPDTGSVISELQGRKIIAVEYGAGDASGLTPFRIPKPIRAATLIAAINSVEASLEPESLSEKGSPAQTDPSVKSSPTALSATDLLSHPGKAGLVIQADHLVCLVDLDGGRYRLTHGASLDHILKNQSKTVVAVSDEKGYSDLADWQSSPSLAWKVGIHLSQGELVNNLHTTSRFKLLRWPPADVPRTASYVLNLCSLLSRKSGASLDEIVELSRIPKSDAIAFINGAYLARALSVRAFNGGGQSPAQVPRPEPVSKGLFEKIRDRLKRKPK